MSPVVPPSLRQVIAPAAIARRVAELGRTISHDYAGRDLLVVGVLKGAFIFTADLVRHLDLDLTVDFIRAASYGDGTASSGRCTVTRDLESDPTGRHVLLVEDIVDTGITVAFLRRHLEEQGARSVAVCALIDKSERRQCQVQIDYAGFQVASGFLVGYGLDHAEHHRQLPAVYTLNPPAAKEQS